MRRALWASTHGAEDRVFARAGGFWGGGALRWCCDLRGEKNCWKVWGRGFGAPGFCARDGAGVGGWGGRHDHEDMIVAPVSVQRSETSSRTPQSRRRAKACSRPRLPAARRSAAQDAMKPLPTSPERSDGSLGQPCGSGVTGCPLTAFGARHERRAMTRAAASFEGARPVLLVSVKLHQDANRVLPTPGAKPPKQNSPANSELRATPPPRTPPQRTCGCGKEPSCTGPRLRRGLLSLGVGVCRTCAPAPTSSAARGTLCAALGLSLCSRPARPAS